MKVLLVEDTPFFQMVEKDYLKDAGMSVTVVSDGEEAWEKLEHDHFDLVISDLIMPNLDVSAFWNGFVAASVSPDYRSSP